MTDTGRHQAVVVTDDHGGFASTVVAMVLRPARAGRAQQVGLLLVALLALGPIAAAIALLGQGGDPTETVVPDLGPAADGELKVVATVTAVDAENGELRFRIDPEPGAGLVEGGVAAADLTVRTTALTGPALQVYPAGSVVSPYEITVPMSGGNVSRYPFDEYEATVLLAGSSDGEPVPLRLVVSSVSLDHRIAPLDQAVIAGAGELAGVTLQVDRSGSTLVYAVGVMAVMWLFAIAGVLVSWSTVIWRVDPPMWVYGFFVGVLFALPPLRDSMPGDPPAGTVVDVVAFYWSVATIAVTLLLLLSSWLREARSARSQVPAEQGVSAPP